MGWINLETLFQSTITLRWLQLKALLRGKGESTSFIPVMEVLRGMR